VTIQINVKIIGHEKLSAALRQITVANVVRHEATRQGFNQAGFLLGREARNAAPIGIARKTTGARSGLLRSAIGHKLTKDGVIVGVDVGRGDTKRRRYASAQEFGSRPHVIQGRTAKGLRFFSGGRWVRTQSVNHPGTREQSFLWIAARENEKRVVELISSGVGRAVKSLIGGK